MRRRNFLKATGASSIAMVSGCISDVKDKIPGVSSVSYPLRPTSLFQSDVGRSGYLPDEQIRTHGEGKWSIKLNSTYMDEYVPTPLVVDGEVVSLSDSGRVYNVTTKGNIKSRKAITRASAVRSTPALAGGVIYVNSYVDGLFALSRKSGEVLWRNTKLRLSTSSPLYYDGSIYVQGEENTNAGSPVLAKIDAKNGTTEWTINLGGRTKSSPLYDSNNKQVVVGNKDGLVAVDAETGSVNWSKESGKIFRATPSLANGKIVCSGNRGTVVALDAQSGKKRWETTIGGYPFAGASVDKGEQIVYTGSSNGVFVALDLNNGDEIWSHNNDYRVVTPPTVCSNAIVYNEWRSVKFVNKRTGKVESKFTSDKNQIFTTPEIYNGHVYIAESETLKGGALGQYTEGSLRKI